MFGNKRKKTIKKLSKEALKKSIDDVAKKLLKTCVFACFPAGTPIQTENGIKNIEDIQVGEMVWAFDEETEEISLQPVVDVMQNETDHTIELYIADERIETTALHPFYTDKGWKDASELNIKDKILDKNNNWHQIKGHNFLYQKKKVYNFTVANFHTYFVGLLALLVHNAGRCLSQEIKKLNGKWIQTFESMSDAAKKYQEFITGVNWNQSFLVNGVKFDGVAQNFLKEAKSGYKNFVKNGDFYSWFKGKDELLKQAERQIKAAEGNQIKWFLKMKK